MLSNRDRLSSNFGLSRCYSPSSGRAEFVMSVLEHGNQLTASSIVIKAVTLLYALPMYLPVL